MDHSLPKTSGYTIRAKYLLEAQVDSGHDVTVVTSPSQGPEAQDEQIAGIRYRRTHYLAWESLLAKNGAKHLVFGNAIGRVLSAILDQEQFDVVHAHTPFHVARVARREAHTRKLPFIYEKRNLWEESAKARGKAVGRWPLYNISRSVDRHLTIQADAVCTITQALKNHTVALGARAEKVFVVGNGVDTANFLPRQAPVALRSKCAANGNFVIGFIGSFFSYEGLLLLVEAFASLIEKYPAARLVLVGDGEDKKKLDGMVPALGLSEQVWLAGKVPHDQVVDFYASMDLLVYPRIHSALTDMISPLKPLEPMAMGKCVLGSDVGGIRELLDEGRAGLLFKAGSATDLEQQLDQILSGAINTIEIGRAAREHVVKNRQWSQMAQIYDCAYEYAKAHRK